MYIEYMDKAHTQQLVTYRHSRPAALVLLALVFGLVNGANAQFSTGDEYNLLDYAGSATANPIARLHDALESGETVLDYKAGERGYLDSLLAQLDIDPESQMLVFSPTSLQHKLISPERPRAVFFNETTFIGFVQNSTIVEVTTIDDEKGLVFYTFDNVPRESKLFERADQTCLVCHDTQGTMGGGVPMLMALSSVYSTRNVPLKNYSGIGNVTDSTPIADRWGGWYVTGRHGLQPHLGNILLERPEDLDNLDDFRIWNLESMADSPWMDPSPYPADTSDIVALMVLEHQVTVQNQITYVKFKAPAVLKRREMAHEHAARSWADLTPEAQNALTRMLDNLVQDMVFIGAADLQSPISGNAAYAQAFVARGPVDGEGRSLREFDLRKSLFRYPLSYLVYTDDFNALPVYTMDYIYSRLEAWLSGDLEFDGPTQFTLAERRTALDILKATHPGFQDYLARRSAEASGLETARLDSWR